MQMIDRHLRLVNLTGHDLILTDGVVEARLESNGQARVVGGIVTTERVVMGGGKFAIPVLETVEDGIDGLPAEEDNVLYVVSGVVAAKAGRDGRMDVVTPSRVKRQRGGRVISARALLRILKG